MAIEIMHMRAKDVAVPLAILALVVIIRTFLGGAWIDYVLSAVTLFLVPISVKFGPLKNWVPSVQLIDYVVYAAVVAAVVFLFNFNSVIGLTSTVAWLISMGLLIFWGFFVLFRYPTMRRGGRDWNA